ncbi:reverse transcriptase domain-containing protein [Tanacetum coccineum]
MPTRSAGKNPITPYPEPERFIHQTLRKKKKRNPFIPIKDRVPKTKYPPFKNLFEAEVVYNPFLDLPFLMADDQPMWGNNRAVAPTPGAAIVAVDLGDNFTVKGHHLSMIKDRQIRRTITGRSAQAHHRIYRTGEAKIWFNELSLGVITTWEEMRQAFVSRFFQPVMFDRLIGEIRGFTQQHHESLVDAWLRMKGLLRSCHGHGLGRGTIIQIFYHGLDEPTQAILDAGGIFLYKTPNEAHQLLEDRVLLKLDWSKENKTKPLHKTVAFAKSEENSPLLEKMEALTTKIDS